MQRPTGGASAEHEHAARADSREAKPDMRRAEPSERSSSTPTKPSSPKRESPMDKKPAGSSVTRVVLLMTIVGLVGASGYLIYKKVRPGTTVALASASLGEAKEGEKKADGEKHAEKHKGAGKTKTKPEGEVGVEPETAQVKTLDEQQEPGEVALDPLTETAQNETAPKTLDAVEPGPAEQLTETEPIPQQEPEPAVAVGPRGQPGRLKNRAKEEAHSEPRVLETPVEDQGAEALSDAAPLVQPEVEPVAAQPGANTRNSAARNPQEPADLQPLDTPSLADTPAQGQGTAAVPAGAPTPAPEVPMPEMSLEPEAAPAIAGAGENDPRLGNYAPAESVPEVQIKPRKGGRPAAGGNVPTPVAPKGGGTQLSPQIETQEATEQFPTRRLPVPTKAPAKAGGSPGTDPAAEKYIVQPNDNFWLIAKKQYGTARYFRALMKYNESKAADPYTLKPGLEVLTPPRETLQKLHPELIDMNPVDRKSPGKGGATTSEAEGETTGLFVGPSGEPMYRVGSEDTLSGISQKTLGRSSRYMEIFEANKELMGSPDRLKPGIVLRLPQDASQLKVVSSPRPEFR